jgi:hypothetical protein
VDQGGTDPASRWEGSTPSRLSSGIRAAPIRPQEHRAWPTSSPASPSATRERAGAHASDDRRASRSLASSVSRACGRYEVATVRARTAARSEGVSRLTSMCAVPPGPPPHVPSALSEG